jgi:hypothetical protein
VGPSSASLAAAVWVDGGWVRAVLTTLGAAAWAGVGFSQEWVDFEIDTYDFEAAIGEMTSRALAKFGEFEVSELAEFETDGDEGGIDFEAGLAFEFKEHIDGAGIVGTPAENPPS